MSNRWKNICVVCNYNLKWEIEHRPEEYATCTNCARVFCTHHEGADWELFICPKCNASLGPFTLHIETHKEMEE